MERGIYMEPKQSVKFRVCHNLKGLCVFGYIEITLVGLQDSFTPKHTEALFPQFLYCFTDYYKPLLTKQVYVGLVNYVRTYYEFRQHY